MADTMKDCRCGRRIPNSWRNCAQCESFARMDAQDGSFELRQERAWGARAALAHNREVEPHIGPELRAKIAGEASKRAQEASILGIRKVSRILKHTNLQVQLHNLRIEDPE